ncbi:glyoxalase [Pseudomonas floridensis]|uniref:Glyoxalase n=1 Tax=Pseudomonas floridensis TaxID=1958950 RepID=A0A1X0N3B7_9PSED|nr:VOC family protein [Pseudomonas floridensis]ORC58004.1 glyoxalase [Pseudomonas floridensis]
MTAKAIPEGYHSLTAYLSVQGAADAIEFYKQAFGASEVFRLNGPDGRIGHAELRIGDSRLMVTDGCDQGPLTSPGETPSVGLHLYVEDVDAVFKRAIEAGATQVSEVSDQFYGDRMGTLKDPGGHVWLIATHQEDLTHEQIEARAKDRFPQKNT